MPPLLVLLQGAGNPAGTTSTSAISMKPKSDDASAGSGSKSSKGGEVLSIGDEAPDFTLTDTDGTTRRLSDFRGRRVLLSFFRYVACPLCQYNIDQMRERTEMLSRAGITTVCVFRSKSENVAKHSARLEGSVALGDKKGTAFGAFQARRASLLKINFQFMTDYKKTGKKLKPYLGRANSMEAMRETRGRNYVVAKQLPAEFLIDEEGMVFDLFRAKKIDDHMPFERIEAFIPEDKRCTCNQWDCISPRCRRKYEELQELANIQRFGFSLPTDIASC